MGVCGSVNSNEQTVWSLYGVYVCKMCAINGIIIIIGQLNMEQHSAAIARLKVNDVVD